MLTVNGSGFGTDALVYWGTATRTTTYVSTSQVTANIMASDIMNAGTVQVYVHSGGQYAWDSAAPVAVANAAGLHTSRIDGSPLEYNQESSWLPDLLICRSELAADVLAALHAHA